MNAEARHQLDILSSGVAEILPGDGLAQKIENAQKEKRPIIVKLGVDPTAPDLHIGHAVPLRKLRQFQDLGHKAVLIIGDFTAMVGDPSGRSTTRPALTSEQVEANAKTYTDQAFNILDSSPDKLEIKYNGGWLGKLDFPKILELTARFTVAGLLVRDDFMKRYKGEQPIGLHEFLYPVMQAYDSVEIGADIELGGTDQRFNLLAGRELQEKLGLDPQVALTMPILEGTDGVKKMSKSYNNHIGLTFEPADMFGKVMSIPDEAPEQRRFSMILKYYTLALGYPPEKIASLSEELCDDKLHPRDAKAELARQIVTTYHSAEAADAARDDFQARFKASSGAKNSGKVDESLAEEKEISSAELDDGQKIWLPKLLTQIGAAASNGEGRRLISQGGVRYKDEVVSDPKAEIVITGDEILQVGKRKIYRLKVV